MNVMLMLAVVTNAVPVPPAPSADSGLGLLVTLIPIVVPLIVAALKWAFAKLPTWSLPILATALGALLNYVLTISGQPHTNIVTAALLGAAGVGLREVVDQVKSKVVPEIPKP